MSMINETKIINRVLDGDSESYRHLVERYNILRDRSSAEDIAQEAYIAAYQRL